MRIQGKSSTLEVKRGCLVWVIWCKVLAEHPHGNVTIESWGVSLEHAESVSEMTGELFIKK